MISWVADHRKHHAFSDEEGDPHSPHVGHGGGWRGALSGPLPRPHGLALHPHPARRQGALRARPDQGPGRQLRRPHLPGLGRRSGCAAVRPRLAIGGTLYAALTGLLWGGAVRMLRPPPRHLQHQLALPLLRQRASTPATSRATCSGSRCPPSASPGTTTTTPSPPPPPTACAAGRSTSPRSSSAGSRAARPRLGRRARRAPQRQAPDGRRPPRSAVATHRPAASQRARGGPSRRGRSQLELWDGTARAAATGAGPDAFRARSPRRRRRTCCAPRASSASAAPTCPGELEVDDLDAALELLDTWKPPPLDRAARARLALAAAARVRPDAPAAGARRRAAPARPAPQPRARRPRRAPPLRPAARVLRAVPRASR